MCSVLWDFPRLRYSLVGDVPLYVVVVAAVFWGVGGGRGEGGGLFVFQSR